MVAYFIFLKCFFTIYLTLFSFQNERMIMVPHSENLKRSLANILSDNFPRVLLEIEYFFSQEMGYVK